MSVEVGIQAVAERLIERALDAGATEAEAFAQNGERAHIQVIRGRVENLTRAGFKGVGLRVLVEGRLAFLSSSDFSEQTLDGLVAEAVSLAAEATAEPYNALPEMDAAPEIPGLYDPDLAAVSLDRKLEVAKRLDALVFDQGPEIHNTEGSVYSDGVYENLILNSKGLVHRWRESFVSMVVSPVAEGKGQKQVAHDWTSARAFRDLKPPEDVAREACRRAKLLLGGEAVETQKVPVVLDARAGAALLGGLGQAINGESVYRGRSFLVDQLGKKIGSDRVTVIDDGTIESGMGSSPVDGEGVPTRRKLIVEKGVLRCFLYDTYSARKAKTRPTGNSARDSYASRPVIGTLNFYLEAGERTPGEVLSEVDNGFFVLRTLGGATNPVTGDFSAGAAGVWIKNGQLTQPVAKVTIAAKMLDMLQGIDAVANDLTLDSPTATPTYRVREMTVSGT